ncbi:Stage V sporulation protein K, partial [termite gut metagenome]
MAEIYKELGTLKKGHLIETDRSGLIAEYVGQTAVKTNKIIDSALDGVLFIDEAYSLVFESDNDYGKEAIATLLKRMEDNRDRLIVILAGYTNEMKEFINSNPGLQSRFNRYIEFPDYSASDLYRIFEQNFRKFDYTISNNASKVLQEYFCKSVAEKNSNFGNARFGRIDNLTSCRVPEKCRAQAGNRIIREYTCACTAACPQPEETFSLILPYAKEVCMDVFMTELSGTCKDYGIITTMDRASW